MSIDANKAADALYACGHTLLQRGSFAPAAEVFRGMVMCAPRDERGWLALGMCHEGAEQELVAAQMYQVAVEELRSVRCAVAFANLARRLGRDGDADDAFDKAEAWASELDDEELQTLVRMHKENAS